MTASTRFTRFRRPGPVIRPTRRSWLYDHAQERLCYALVLRAARAGRVVPAALPAEPAIVPERAPQREPAVATASAAAGSPAAERAEALGELLLDVPIEPAPRALVIHPVLPAAEPVIPPVVEPAPPFAAERATPPVIEPVPPQAGDRPVAPGTPAPQRDLARLAPVVGIAAVIALATLWLVVREWRWLSLPIDRREAIARRVIDRWRGPGAFAELDARNARQWQSSDTP